MNFRVWIRSVAGFYAQYDGYVDVYADDIEQAEERAFLKLKRGAFPDRSRDMWNVEKIEVLKKGGKS